jgi:cytochrome c oxidase cbb3-type subunit 3
MAMANNGLICAALALGVGLAFPALGGDSARDNYRTYCTQCHGKDGNGKGINIRDMSVQPRDHTDAKAMSGRSDDTIFKVIKEGGPSIDKSVLMPPWGDTFSDDEIRDLVAYLRQLCKCAFGAGS